MLSNILKDFILHAPVTELCENIIAKNGLERLRIVLTDSFIGMPVIKIQSAGFHFSAIFLEKILAVLFTQEFAKPSAVVILRPSLCMGQLNIVIQEDLFGIAGIYGFGDRIIIWRTVCGNFRN